ncbi:MAG TPA: hypothetical protein VM074_10690, partial [Solimonas sp.]|nr:hypothetical protein [Solimonas sp.]
MGRSYVYDHTGSMKRLLPCLLASLALPLAAHAGVIAPERVQEALDLHDEALEHNRAYALVESLTEEVGARPAGSAGDRRAVAWALRTFKQLGFHNVHAEPVSVRHWERGDIRAELLGDKP